MSDRLTIVETLDHPELFAPHFAGESWARWRVVLKGLFGLPMTEGDARTFHELTGRVDPPCEQAREGWFVCGRRSGKSAVTALVGVFLACFRDYRPHLKAGERATVMLLAGDKKQARTLFRYARGLVESVPMLAAMVQRVSEESISFNSRVDLEIHTCSFRSVRGYTIAAALLDEVAYWYIDGANPDSEVVAALRPALATIPGSMLIGLSSPYSRRGVLWTAYERHFGREDSDVLVVQGATRALNPTIPEGVVARAYREDAAVAASEWEAQWRTDVAAFLDAEVVDRAVLRGVSEIAPEPGRRYFAACDPSGGQHDAYTLAIAHAEGERVVLDLCRGRRAPFDPGDVTREFATICKRYGVSQVRGDKYGGEWPPEAWRANGLSYEPLDMTRSELYLEALPVLMAGRAQLLDQRVLVNELDALERRTGRGRDVVDHPPRQYDDHANAAAAAIVLASRRRAVVTEEQMRVAIEAMQEAQAEREALREQSFEQFAASRSSRRMPWDY
jgi:hypothetical protein